MLTKNLCSGTEIRNLEQTTQTPNLGSLYKLAKIAESVNINQILDLEYLVVDFSTIKLIINVVNEKSMDESRTRLLTSIGIFLSFH